MRRKQEQIWRRTYGLDFGTYGDVRWTEFCYALLEYHGELGGGEAEPLLRAG